MLGRFQSVGAQREAQRRRGEHGQIIEADPLRTSHTCQHIGHTHPVIERMQEHRPGIAAAHPGTLQPPWRPGAAGWGHRPARGPSRLRGRDNTGPKARSGPGQGKLRRFGLPLRRNTLHGELIITASAIPHPDPGGLGQRRLQRGRAQPLQHVVDHWPGHAQTPGVSRSD